MVRTQLFLGTELSLRANCKVPQGSDMPRAPWSSFTRTQEYVHSDPRICTPGPKNIFTRTQEYFYLDPRIFLLGHKNILTQIQEYFLTRKLCFLPSPPFVYFRGVVFKRTSKINIGGQSNCWNVKSRGLEKKLKPCKSLSDTEE